MDKNIKKQLDDQGRQALTAVEKKEVENSVDNECDGIKARAERKDPLYSPHNSIALTRLIMSSPASPHHLPQKAWQMQLMQSIQPPDRPT